MAGSLVCDSFSLYWDFVSSLFVCYVCLNVCMCVPYGRLLHVTVYVYVYVCVCVCVCVCLSVYITAFGIRD